MPEILENFEMLYKKGMEKIIYTSFVKNELLESVKEERNIVGNVKRRNVI
jgi:hypothetical protein